MLNTMAGFILASIHKIQRRREFVNLVVLIDKFYKQNTSHRDTIVIILDYLYKRGWRRVVKVGQYQALLRWKWKRELFYKFNSFLNWLVNSSSTSSSSQSSCLYQLFRVQKRKLPLFYINFVFFVFFPI